MNSVPDPRPLDEQVQYLRNKISGYVRDCADARCMLIEVGTLDEVFTAMKGELSMAISEGRLDIVKELIANYEELCHIDTHRELLDRREYQTTFGELYDET